MQTAVVGKGVADLRIGDVLADHVAQRALRGEVADFADEVRTPTLADARLEAINNRASLHDVSMWAPRQITSDRQVLRICCEH